MGPHETSSSPSVGIQINRAAGRRSKNPSLWAQGYQDSQSRLLYGSQGTGGKILEFRNMSGMPVDGLFLCLPSILFWTLLVCRDGPSFLSEN